MAEVRMRRNHSGGWTVNISKVELFWVQKSPQGVALKGAVKGQ